jgi:hypothetical protein
MHAANFANILGEDEFPWHSDYRHKHFEIRADQLVEKIKFALKGLRLTGYLDEDHYVESGKRQRAVGQVTFEHPLVNAGADYVTFKDQTSTTKAAIDGKGYTVWATPRLGTSGWELLLRHDEIEPNKDVSSQKRKRNIAGLAYWIPRLTGVSSAVMVDYDKTTFPGFNRADDTRYGLKMLINF